jgi:hypothetical protein
MAYLNPSNGKAEKNDVKAFLRLKPFLIGNMS